MAEQDARPSGPDLSQGVAFTDLADGAMLLGHVGDEQVLLARHGAELFAVGASCSHYHGPLAEGLLVGDTVRCPWHHACFSLRTGRALRPPALNDVTCWRVEQRGEMVYVTGKVPAPVRTAARPRGPSSVVIVGAGAAGESAAETLRREGYEGSLTIFDTDPDAPYDRPNLSKDYLAGTASEDWIPLHPPEIFSDRGIEIIRDRRVMAIEPRDRSIRL